MKIYIKWEGGVGPFETSGFANWYLLKVGSDPPTETGRWAPSLGVGWNIQSVHSAALCLLSQGP